MTARHNWNSCLRNRVIKHLGLVVILWATAVISTAQSIDPAAPTPISAHDLSGSIAARDLGDSRLTQHFYAFGGNPGDVLITITSRNLNGDVDIFTASTLRPLLKFTLYAESSTPVTKGIYLRRHEDLILRVEARSPNDDEGSYQIRFGGSFEPLAAPLIAEREKAESTPDVTTPRTGRRVSSVGARIPEPPRPVEEVAVATPTPAPTPEATPEAAAEPAPPRATTRRGRGRAATRRTTPRVEPVTREKTKPAESETKEPDKVAVTTEPEPAKPTRTGRRGTRAPAPTSPEPEPPSGPRLVLEMLDGTRMERFMSTIRRVTIENNQIVVVGKDGKIGRTRLSEVLRMTIEP